jgi:hypothetical protein
MFDCSETVGDAGFAGGDNLTVVAAVGVFGEGLGVAVDFADVGLAFVGVGGDGVHGDVGGGGVEDKADGLAVGVAAGQGDDAGAVGVGPGEFGWGVAMDGLLVETGEHDVGPVDLVAGLAKVLAYGGEVGGAGGGVFHEPGGLGLVGVVAGAGVDAQLGAQVLADGAGLDEAHQAAGEGGWLGVGGEPDGEAAGGDVVDGFAAAVGVGDAVINEAFVGGQVGEGPAAAGRRAAARPEVCRCLSYA